MGSEAHRARCSECKEAGCRVINGAVEFEMPPDDQDAPSSSPQPVAVPLTPAERVRKLVGLGPLVRLATGIPTLDRACRGGLPTRRLVVYGGAPGAGKTTLATGQGWRWAKSGTPVAMLAVDEGPEGVLMRIAQLEGLPAERIEERDEETLEALAEKLDAAELVLVDADDAAGSVEGTAMLLAARAAGKPAVLIVDSIQTVRAAGTEDADSPRARVDCVMRALKWARDKYGFLTIATCELARGAYRSRSIAEAINDLAAFKESGSVEYAAQTAIVLRSVPDEASLVDVTVPKNRAYRKDAFRLRLDHMTTALEEVPMPEPSENGRRRISVDHVEDDAQHIRKLLLEQPGLGGKRAVRVALRARQLSLGNDRVDVALAYLTDRRELENRGTDHRPALFLRQETTRDAAE